MHLVGFKERQISEFFLIQYIMNEKQKLMQIICLRTGQKSSGSVMNDAIGFDNETLLFLQQKGF